jgi:hypothetical protein
MYPSDASATMIVRSCVPVVNACANVIFWTTDVADPAKSARRRSCDLRVNEYTPFCNGPGDVKSPRVIVTPPSSRFCPWSAPRPPHYGCQKER